MIDDLLRLDTKVTMALGGLDARATQSGPRGRPGKWNIQEIAEHLQLVVEANTRAIIAQAGRGSALRGRVRLGQRLGRWLVLSSRWMPTGRKSPAALMPSRPVTLKTGDQLAERLHARLVEFRQAGEEVRMQSGEGAVAVHPVLGPLSFVQWSRFHLVHGEHHLKQIGQIRREWGL